MRPLWRNSLWLCFAVACGLVGYQQGLGQGGAIIAKIATSNATYDAFADLSAALDALDKQPGEFADRSLRATLFALGEKAPVLEGWWECHARHPKLLTRASAYLKVHPKAPNPPYDAIVARGLGICESVKRKPE